MWFVYFIVSLPHSQLTILVVYSLALQTLDWCFASVFFQDHTPASQWAGRLGDWGLQLSLWHCANGRGGEFGSWESDCHKTVRIVSR